MSNEPMCIMIKAEKPPKSHRKKHIYLIGTLLSPVRIGKPAHYLYQGNHIRTSTVLTILEASNHFICFETRNSIYRLEYSHVPSDCYGQCA